MGLQSFDDFSGECVAMVDDEVVGVKWGACSAWSGHGFCCVIDEEPGAVGAIVVGGVPVAT